MIFLVIKLCIYWFECTLFLHKLSMLSICYIYIYIYICIYILRNKIKFMGIASRCASLTHWGRVTHICVGNITIICSNNGLAPGWRQGIIWSNAGILLTGPFATNINDILGEILTFSFTKRRLIVSSEIWRPFCLDPNVFMKIYNISVIKCVVLSWTSWI